LPTCIFEDSIGHLCNGYIEILNSVISISGIDDPVINRCIDVDGDVVLCYDVLDGKGITCRARSRTLIFKLIIPRVSVQGFI
jgi:hypothetical protein